MRLAGIALHPLTCVCRAQVGLDAAGKTTILYKVRPAFAFMWTAGGCRGSGGQWLRVMLVARLGHSRARWELRALKLV